MSVCKDFLPTVLNSVFFPANTLETLVYDADYDRKEYISNLCFRNSARRIVAIVAPILHAYEFCINLGRTAFHLMTFCCQEKTLKELLFNKDCGSLQNAYDSLQDGYFSIFEMRQKFLYADNLNYGRTLRYMFRYDNM